MLFTRIHSESIKRRDLDKLKPSYHFKRLPAILLALTLAVSGMAQSPPSRKPDDRRSRQQEIYSLSRQARTAESRGQKERALDIWRKIDDMQPGYLSAYYGIRRILLDLGRYDEAIVYLDRMLEWSASGRLQVDPIKITADRIEVLFASGDSVAAIDAAVEALDDYRGNPLIYKELSGIYAKNRLSSEALAILKRGRVDCGDPHLFARDLARWYEALMDWESAIDEYLLYLQESDRNLRFVTGAIADMASNPHIDSLVVQYLDSKLSPDAKSGKVKLGKAASGDIAVHRLLAALHFRTKRYSQALEHYEALGRLTGDIGAELLEFARLTDAEGEYALSWKAYAEILKFNPGNALRTRALMGKAKAAAQIGEIDSAATAYKAVLVPGVKPEVAFEAYFQLGSIEFHQQHNTAKARMYYDEAEKVGRRIKLPAQSTIALTVEKALTYIWDGELTAAEQHLNKLIRGNLRQSPKLSRALTPARFALAELYFRQGKIERLNEELQALLLADPGSPEANDALELRSLLNDLQGSPEFLIKLGRADLEQFRGRFGKAETILEQVVDSSVPRAREEALWRLQRLQVLRGDFSAALVALDSIIAIETALRRDLALLTAGDICSRELGFDERAVQYYETILIEFPDSPVSDKARRRLNALTEGSL